MKHKSYINKAVAINKQAHKYTTSHYKNLLQTLGGSKDVSLGPCRQQGRPGMTS